MVAAKDLPRHLLEARYAELEEECARWISRIRLLEYRLELIGSALRAPYKPKASEPDGAGAPGRNQDGEV